MIAPILALLFAPLVAVPRGTPEPPRRQVDLSMPAQTGRRIAVAAGADLQAALDRARPGDTLVLAAGATFVGPFVLPPSRGDGWIVVASGSPALPEPGRRVTPGDAPAMATLESATAAVLRAPAGAQGWRLVGLRLRPRAGAFLHELVTLNGRRVILDRCLLQADPAVGGRRGVSLNGSDLAVLDSWLSGFKEEGADSQAVAAWDAPGPLAVIGNYLEAAGENLMLGGADPAGADGIPSDVEIRRNHLSKPLEWKHERWSVKNLLELKAARRVVIDGNLLEHNWTASQNGFSVLFTVRNQEGRAPFSVVEDVSFTHNVLRDAEAGVSILGHDVRPSGVTSRIRIADDLFLGIDGALFQILEGTVDVSIEHVTGLQRGNVITADGAPHRGFVFRDNLVAHSEYGIIGTNVGTGRPTLDLYFPGAVVAGNALVGGPARAYPSGNLFPATFASLGIDPQGPRIPRADSKHPLPRASDGRTVGADVDAILAALAATDRAELAP